MHRHHDVGHLLRSFRALCAAAPRPTGRSTVSYFMYGALFMMAGAYTLSRNGHVRGDFVYRMWPPRVQASIDLVALHHFHAARRSAR